MNCDKNINKITQIFKNPQEKKIISDEPNSRNSVYAFCPR